MENDRQGQGKIHRLPFDIRTALHGRLLNGRPQAETLDWVNALPETVEMLADFFEGKPITPQNLSDYKNGREYQTWVMRQERLADIRTVSQFARDLGEVTVSGQVSSASVDLAGGHILARLESLISCQADDDELKPVLDAIHRLRLREIQTATLDEKRQDRADKKAAKAADLEEKRLQRLLREKELEEKARERQDRRDKFELEAAGKLLELARSQEVQAVITGPLDQTSKIQQLRRFMYPQLVEDSP